MKRYVTSQVKELGYMKRRAVKISTSGSEIQMSEGLYSCLYYLFYIGGYVEIQQGNLRLVIAS